MLMQIGQTANRALTCDAHDVGGMLIDCHGRIRQFIRVARALAHPRPLPDGQAVDGAERVLRYFTIGLPLHVQDEDETVLPRLRGRASVVDAALDRMFAEHQAVPALCERLAAACRAVMADPAGRLGMLDTLGPLVAEVEGHFEPHLQNEEAVIIPALRLLEPPLQQAMLAEVRARRVPRT
jgi:iron-sulfur cluster repair protein YtfE (RIC family)